MVKEEAKAELKKGALAMAVEYAMRFRRSALFLIREKHLGIDFSKMRGSNVVDPNDGSTTSLVGEVEE